MAEAGGSGGGGSDLEWVGDDAIAIPVAGQPGSARTTAAVRGLAEAIRSVALPEVVDIVPSPERVTVCYDLAAANQLDTLVATLEAVARETAAAPPPQQAKVHEIPVRYGGDAGPDLEDVCQACHIDRTTLIRRHTGTDYLVTAVGFTPGFTYLGGLDATLAVPRRATPRTQVPAGSVGIGGSQTGVYPCASPGGWHIIGHTNATFFDPQAAPPALCRVGDTVRFVETGERGPAPSPQFGPQVSPGPAARGRTGRPGITVLAPGLLTTIQDLGRPGFRASGVTQGGAADPVAAAVANLLVGNPPEAAVLELTLAGPTLRFESDRRVALTGAAFPGLPGWRPLELTAGTTLTLGHATRGCRGYLAVAGGIAVPEVLGSRSTHLAAGFGGFAGRALQAGDRLAMGDACRPPTDSHWSLSPSLLPLPSQPQTLRLILPDAQPLASATRLLGPAYRVTSRSNRMGLRLAGPPIEQPGDGRSRAVLPGTVQLPPDGQPILLLADSQTIGGYPVLGHVASADLRLAAQLRPGDGLVFSTVSRAEAHAAWRHQQAQLADIGERITARWSQRLP